MSLVNREYCKVCEIGIVAIPPDKPPSICRFCSTELFKKGALCTHENGNKYEILCLANTYSTRKEYPVTVVYQDIENRLIWSKTLENFMERMRLD